MPDKEPASSAGSRLIERYRWRWRRRICRTCQIVNLSTYRRMRLQPAEQIGAGNMENDNKDGDDGERGDA